MTTVDEWLALVLDDFRDTPAAAAGVAVVDLDPTHLDDVADSVPDPASWVDPAEPERHRLLLRVGGNITSLDDVADAPAAAAVEIASYLQDFVADAWNRPWPERPGPDGRTTVLEPRLSSAGAPEWVGKGVALAFGELRATRP